VSEQPVGPWLRLVYPEGYDAPRPEEAARLLAEDPSLAEQCPLAIGEIAGTAPWGMPPLIAVTFSTLIRFERFAPQLRRAAQTLLEAGADVNATWINPIFPDSPLTALYGAAGLNHDAEMTRILLAHGANPDDNESLYHAVETTDLTCARLLLEAGATVRGTNAAARVLDFDNLEGLKLLLAHGGEPRLHHAIVRRRSAEHVRELLKAGAPTEGAWKLAMLSGLPHLAALLPEEPLTDTERFIAACAAADRTEATRLRASLPLVFESMTAHQLGCLPHMAQSGRNEAVQLMVELGWPIETKGGDIGGNALNNAVFRGDAPLTRFLLAHGADWRGRHNYNDNVVGTLSFMSRNGTPGALDCAKALIESGMPAPSADYTFSREVTEYFRTLS
jgi:ankyrin repeat protein